MKPGRKPMYRVQEFAQMAGVTIRALHHYDHLNLLKPKRTTAGYRLYVARDLERLEQIVTLKFIGLSLKEIRSMLGPKAAALPDALRMQRRALEHKRRLLDRAIDAIRQAESATAGGEALDSELLKNIIEVIEMQENENWTSQYYSESAQAKIKERQKLWNPELQEQVTKKWLALIDDVQKALDNKEDPASPRGQELGRRWKELVEGFTAGDPAVTQGVSKMWADKANWPDNMQRQAQPFQITQEMFAFVQKAWKAAK